MLMETKNYINTAQLEGKHYFRFVRLLYLFCMFAVLYDLEWNTYMEKLLQGTILKCYIFFTPF